MCSYLPLEIILATRSARACRCTEIIWLLERQRPPEQVCGIIPMTLCFLTRCCGTGKVFFYVDSSAPTRAPTIQPDSDSNSEDDDDGWTLKNGYAYFAQRSLYFPILKWAVFVFSFDNLGVFLVVICIAFLFCGGYYYFYVMKSGKGSLNEPFLSKNTELRTSESRLWSSKQQTISYMRLGMKSSFKCFICDAIILLSISTLYFSNTGKINSCFCIVLAL